MEKQSIIWTAELFKQNLVFEAFKKWELLLMERTGREQMLSSWSKVFHLKIAPNEKGGLYFHYVDFLEDISIPFKKKVL